MTLAKPDRTLAEKLREFPILSQLTDSSIGKLAGISELRRFSEGTVLFSEGELHNQIYLICTGTVRLEMVTAKCGRQSILSVGRGDFLAWSAIVGDGLTTATAIVVEETQAVVFNAPQLKKLLADNLDLGYHVMHAVAQALAQRLLATRLQLLDLYHY